MLGEQNLLSILSEKGVSTVLQKSIVPWLVASFGVDCPTQITADIVRQMVRALVKRDNNVTTSRGWEKGSTPLWTSIPKLST